MITYEIVNPSDATTFLAPDRTIALAVVALVGEGFYAAKALARGGKRLGDEEAEALYVPMFIEQLTQSYNDWWPAAGYRSEPIGVALDTRKAEVIAALRSCAYGDLEDRRTYDDACAAITDPAKLAQFKAGCEDRRRSSMNRIVQRAWTMADRLEARAAA